MMRFIDYSRPRDTELPAWPGAVLLAGAVLSIIAFAVVVETQSAARVSPAALLKGR